jgi:PAS domain-containing protein
MGIQRMRTELHDLEARLDEAADRNWEIREAQERAATLLEAQDDLIGRRDASGVISYVNDAYCALAARTRAELLATTFSLPVIDQGDTSVMADGT